MHRIYKFNIILAGKKVAVLLQDFPVPATRRVDSSKYWHIEKYDGEEHFVHETIKEICSHEKVSAEEVQWFIDMKYKDSSRLRKGYYSKYFCWNVPGLIIRTCEATCFVTETFS